MVFSVPFSLHTCAMDSSYPPRFDHLYAISDLHLGGRQGFQIFSQGERLAATIGRLRHGIGDDQRLALVINGDFVDFLAEHPHSCFNQRNAVEDLERVMADPAFAPVFEALAAFISRHRNHLVVTLGNHDLELCLPPVRHALLARLAGGDPAARSRIRLVADGSGFRCRTGGAHVLLVHGNATDPWNRIDVAGLLAAKAACVSGRTPVDFPANPGTRLVIEVLNGLKRSYPFVDLLKPEIPVVVAILHAVAGEKSRLTKWLWRLPEILAGPLDDKMAMACLSDRETPGVPQQTRRALRELQELDRVFAGLAPEPDDNALLAAAWQQYVNEISEGVPGEDDEILLDLRLRKLRAWLPSWMDMVGSSEEKAESLRRTLNDVLREDRSFSITGPDRIRENIADLAGDEINFLVAGHTHLCRSIGISGSRHYLNSGTWTDLLCFPADLLQDRERFFKVFQAIGDGADAAGLKKIEPAMIREEYTLAHIRAENNGVRGELLQAARDGSLTDVSNSTRFISTP